MTTNKISTKIKLLGALLIVSTFTVIVVSIMLNQKNVSDALIINIAGKERMLSQKITKSVYFLKNTGKTDFRELDGAIEDFLWGINTLKNGRENLNITPAPTQQIRDQIDKVLKLWKPFHDNVETFKKALINGNEEVINQTFMEISRSNNTLLNEIDNIVTLYTNYTREKTDFIKNFQYGGFTVLFLLVAFSILKLKRIESHAKEFLNKSKEIMQRDLNAPIEPMDIDGENEIEEVANSLNCFIGKVNSAMSFSKSAMEQSKQASHKLEELTEEFSTIIDDLHDCKGVSTQIDKSEDIMIQSSEDLLRSTQKLENLKSELDALLKSCKSP